MKDTVRHNCCAMQQINAANSTTAAEIITAINNGRSNAERSTFFIVVKTPDEKDLETTVRGIGFAEVVQFNRRPCYSQDTKLKMFFIEPEFAGGKIVLGKNKVKVLNEDADNPPQPKVVAKKEEPAPVKRPVGRPRKHFLLTRIRHNDYADERWNRYTIKSTGLYKTRDNGQLLPTPQLAKGSFIINETNHTINQL